MDPDLKYMTRLQIRRKRFQYKHYWISFRYSPIMNKKFYQSKLINGFMISWKGITILINWDKDLQKTINKLNLGEYPSE